MRIGIIHYQRVDGGRTVVGSIVVSLSAVTVVFILGFCGFWVRRKDIVTHQGLTDFSRVLIELFLPAAFFYSTFSQFDLGQFHKVVLPGLGQLLLFVLGIVGTGIFVKIWTVNAPRGTLFAMASLQNNVYLPLPLVMALLSGNEAERAKFYIGCFVLFFTPVLWSLGVVALSGEGADGMRPSRWKLIVNPPFLAALFGIVLKVVFTLFHLTLPHPVRSALKLMGEGTVPVAMLVLGGLLAEVGSIRRVGWRAIYCIAGVKLVFVPLLTLIVLCLWRPSDTVFQTVLMVEAAAPPATNISLIVRRFGGEKDLVASATFVTYLLSILTIPLWLLLYQLVLGRGSF